MRSSRRGLRILRWALWALVALAAAVAWKGQEAAPTDAHYTGTDLGGEPAPPFTLANQDGRPVSLADYRGRTVLLTFLDGHCKDVCPATLRTMADVQARLGREAGRLAVVAISVDPWLDPVGKPAFIAQEPGIVAPRQWDFLTGTLSQLKPVWAGFHVSVIEEEVGTFGANGAHDSGFFLLDARGRQVRYIQSDADLDVIVAQVRRVIGRGG